MEDHIIKFLSYGHDLQLGNGAAFLPRVPFPRADILKWCSKGSEEHLVRISLVMWLEFGSKGWHTCFQLLSFLFFPPFSSPLLFFPSPCHLLPPPLQMSSTTWWDPLLLPQKTHSLLILRLALLCLCKQTPVLLTPAFHLPLVLCVMRWHMHIILPGRTS